MGGMFFASPEDFAQVFTGHAIVRWLSSETIEHLTAPALTVDPEIVTAEQALSPAIEVTVSNAGALPLSIRTVDVPTGSGCGDESLPLTLEPRAHWLLSVLPERGESDRSPKAERGELPIAHLRIRSTDALRPSRFISVVAMQRLDVEPSGLDLGSGRSVEIRERTRGLTVRYWGGRELVVIPSVPWLAVTLSEEASLSPLPWGDRMTLARVDVGIEPSARLSPGGHDAELKLRLLRPAAEEARSQAEEVAVPVHLQVLPVLRAEPSALFFGVLPRGENASRVTRIRGADGASLAVDMSSSSLPDCVNTSLEWDETESLYRLTVKLDGGDVPLGELAGEIAVSGRSRDGSPARLRIPFWALVEDSRNGGADHGPSAGVNYTLKEVGDGK